MSHLQSGSIGVTRLTLRIGVVVAGLAVVGTTARAQRRVRGGRAVLVDRPAVGPRVGYNFDADHVFVGGQLNLPVGRRWTLVPSVQLTVTDVSPRAVARCGPGISPVSMSAVAVSSAVIARRMSISSRLVRRTHEDLGVASVRPPFGAACSRNARRPCCR